MIKKILLASLMLMSFSTIAAERITLYWGFNPGSRQANQYRILTTELNKIQSKYEFVFVTKPGAGGAIAAKHILQNPNTTLIGGSSTFFIRANFDKSTGYTLDQFQPVIVQSNNAPVALFSGKYKTFSDVKKSDIITIGISGFGSHSNLLSAVLAESHSGIIIVNYPTLIEANRDAIGKHIDFSWNWLTNAEPAARSGQGYITGITGTNSINGYKTFSSLGINGFERANINQAIFASADMSPTRLKEFHELFRVANQTLGLQEMYDQDHATSLDFNWDQTIEWYKEQIKFWAEQSSKVKPIN